MSGPVREATMVVEVGEMNTWHVDFSRPGWRCPDCRWDVGEPEGSSRSEGPRLVEPCELHQEAMTLRSTA
jgi:hypothetical protein